MFPSKPKLLVTAILKSSENCPKRVRYSLSTVQLTSSLVLYHYIYSMMFVKTNESPIVLGVPGEQVLKRSEIFFNPKINNFSSLIFFEHTFAFLFDKFKKLQKVPRSGFDFEFCRSKNPPKNLKFHLPPQQNTFLNPASNTFPISERFYPILATKIS